MLTFGELKAAERAVLWPSPTEPRNLRTTHDRFFAEAMSELSQWVHCLQVNNTQIFAAGAGFLHCAKSVFAAPHGFIKRVYTIANDGWCSRVFYASRPFAELESFAHKILPYWNPPVTTGTLPPLGEGFQHFNRSSDSMCGRAAIGMWSIWRGRIYIAPWLQSNEKLVVEWDGIKKAWIDEDVLDDELWGIPEKETIRAFVKWKHEFYYGCDKDRTRGFMIEFREQLAHLMDTCDKETEQQIEDETDSGIPTEFSRYQTSDEATEGEVPDIEDDTTLVANIGDYGVDTVNEANVAALVESKSPAFIVTNGDNNYGNPGGSYDQFVGKYYSKWIYPYNGAYEVAAEQNLFWPIPGNHDYDVDTAPKDLRSYRAFFAGLPGNRRYYELVRGAAHFFMLNSQPQEPDGYTATSNQAMWLKAKLALSPARWKIVIIHDSPFTSSEDAPGHPETQWPYKQWGADLVLSGDAHGYERFEKFGFPYIVNGAGGQAITTFGAPEPGSQVIYAGHGAGFLSITCNTLKWEFYSAPDGILRDTLELTKT